MSYKHMVRTLRGDAPGTITELNYFQIGPEDAPKKVYMQAALHADEQPGIMILHHLLPLLKKAGADGLLKAQFVIFPLVNPLGMSDIGFGQHQGRYNRLSGVNYNRQWPDLFQAVSERAADQLTDNPAENVRIVRHEMQTWLLQSNPVTALQQQQHIVMQEAYNADFVFDLHCDNDSLAHIFSVPQSADVMQSLSDWMGASATLMAEESGGHSFDEVWSTVWLKLAAAFPDKPIPLACHSATLEYRGWFDVFDSLNLDDAQRLYGFLQYQGLIGGELIRPKPPATAAPTDLAATEFIGVDEAGLLAYQVELGDTVKKGDVLADLIALEGERAFSKRTPILAGTNGLVLSRKIQKYVWPGCTIAKVVGLEKLASRKGKLLVD